MIRWPNTAARAALIAGTLFCTAALTPLVAQEIQASTPAPATVSQSAAPVTEPVGPRVRVELARVEPSISKAETRAPTAMHKDTTTITITTLALVLLLVLVVVLIAR